MAMDATLQIRMNSDLEAWEGMTAQEINSKLLQSEADIAVGRVYTQDELDRPNLKGRFRGAPDRTRISEFVPIGGLAE